MVYLPAGRDEGTFSGFATAARANPNLWLSVPRSLPTVALSRARLQPPAIPVSRPPFPRGPPGIHMRSIPRSVPCLRNPAGHDRKCGSTRNTSALMSTATAARIPFPGDGLGGAGDGGGT